MKWTTDRNISSVQMATAWLIQRFIDNQADIRFLDADKIDAYIKESAAIPFEVEGVEFLLYKNVPGFQQVLVAYRFNNPALNAMSKWLGQSIEKGLDAALKECGATSIPHLPENSDDRFQTHLEYFDAIYEWFKKKVLSPQEMA